MGRSNSATQDEEARFVIGSAEARSKLLTWLRRNLEGSDRPTRSVNLELRTVGSKGKESADTIYSAHYDFQDPIDQVSDEIVDEAENDALECTGRVKYAVRIEGKSAAGRLTFVLRREARLDSEDGEDFDDLGDIDEEPTNKGHRQQMMRHNEVYAKEMVGMSRSQANFHKDEVESLRTRVKELEKELFSQAKEMIKIYEDLRSLQWMRDREIRKMENEEVRSEKIAGMLMQVAPVLAAAIFGGDKAEGLIDSLLKMAGPALMPGQNAKSGASVNAMSMDDLVDNLVNCLQKTPQKIAEIAQMLDEESVEIFGEMYKRVEQRRRSGRG